jgi:hypothetical protein
VVAGSRSENVRGYGGYSSLPAVRIAPAPIAFVSDRAAALLTLTALYLLAAAALLLPWPFGAHPAWAYNWEGYTAWRWQTYWERPSLAILAPSDGLMTDSGQGPLVGLPVTVGIALAGFDLDAMRVPVTLLAATCIPLLWLLGRRVMGAGPATLAALFLALSPAFLFYGRTATLVGVSLAPLLLTALALARVLDPIVADGWRWRREGLLAGSLLLGIYAYAPVRLLWPLALGLLAFAAWHNRSRRRVLLGTMLLCALIVPAAVMALEQLTSPEPDPVAAGARYFNARGEQLVAMGDNPAEAEQYVRNLGEEEHAAGWEPIIRLVGQNTTDLARLLLDRGTGPVPTEYWNESGRFWPWFLFPLAAVGALTAASQGLFRGRQSAALRLMPLLLFLGLALPLLLTSRVHIGRLLPALPFAILLAASGIWVCTDWLAGLAQRAGGVSARWVAPVLGGALLIPIVVSARAEMTTPLSPSRDALTAAQIATWQDVADERGGAVLVENPALGDDVERVHAATYRLDLDSLYRFVDLNQEGQPLLTTDLRPALYWRGALGALQDGTITDPCEQLWFVGPEIASEFIAAWREAGCLGAPDSVILP